MRVWQAWHGYGLHSLTAGPAVLGCSWGVGGRAGSAGRAARRRRFATLLDPAGLEKIGARFYWWLYVNGLAGLAPGFARKRLAGWLGNPVLPVPELRSVLYAGFRGFRRASSTPAPLTDDELRSIRVPALILAGEHSPLIRPATVRARGQLMPAAQVEIITGTGHGPGFERADYANARITAFIAAAGKERDSVP